MASTSHFHLFIKRMLPHTRLVLLGLSLLHPVAAQVVQFEFSEAEGFESGDIAHHPVWMSNTHTNSVDTSGTGVVKLDPDSQWVNSSCKIGLSPIDSQLTVSADFSFTEAAASGENDIFSLTASDIVSATPVALRAAFRRNDNHYGLLLASESGSLNYSSMFEKSAIGLDGTPGARSDVLSLSMTLNRGNDGSDWTIRTVLSNITQSVEIRAFTEKQVETSEAFYNAPHYYFGISSSLGDAVTGTSYREVERFKIERINLHQEDIPDGFVPGIWTNQWSTKPQVVMTYPEFDPIPKWPKPEEVSLFDIPGTLKTFEVKGSQLRDELDSLPEPNASLQAEGYGFHSDYLAAIEGMPDEPRWTLDFTFSPYITPSKIVLVPAVDHRFRKLESYGFPKRFRVLSVAADGSVRVIKEWMSSDCPDPGRFPLVLDVPLPRTRNIRIEVFRGQQEDNREFFALDEMFGVVRGTDRICHQVVASSEYKSLPYWGIQFLTDQKTGLGLPLDDKADDQINPDQNDFAVAFEVPPTNSCVVELDLGKNRKLGYITLFPAQSPGGIMIPGYGFPESMKVAFVEEKSSGERGITRRVPWYWKELRPGNNVLHLSCANLSGRWIRLQVDKFPMHDGKRTFAMGEFHVHDKGVTYPVEAIRMEGFPRGAASSEADLMRNGKAGGHPVLFLLDWLYKIERRNQLSGSLEELTALEDVLRFRWNHFWKTSGLITGALLLLGALSFALFSTIQRRRYASRLRLQISSDLHDDVGSTLGSITMTAEQLETMEPGNQMSEMLEDLSLMAREACASMREVIWVADQNSTRLPAMVQKLVERAERVMDGTELIIEIAKELPDILVSLTTRRHFIMFYKEVLHNCARHAQATQVNISLSVIRGILKLEVQDDGCGFDLDEPSDGWGLHTLKKRAKELHGKVTIKSNIGEGTSVVLLMPLKALNKEPNRAYKTSN